MTDLLPFLREFGFPVALCLVLLWAIRSQNTQLVKAYTDRISTLERIVRDLTSKVEELERDRMRRADEYGHTLKGIALSWSQAARDAHALHTDQLAVLRRLCDAFHEYMPHRGPTRDDVPADPARRPTDQILKPG